jgi:hypothetical protein
VYGFVTDVRVKVTEVPTAIETLVKITVVVRIEQGKGRQPPTFP